MGRLTFEDDDEQNFDDTDDEPTLNENDLYDSGFEEEPKLFASVPTSCPPRRNMTAARRNRSTRPSNNYSTLAPQRYESIVRTPNAHIVLVRHNGNLVLITTVTNETRIETKNGTFVYTYSVRHIFHIPEKHKALLSKLLRMRFQK